MKKGIIILAIITTAFTVPCLAQTTDVYEYAGLFYGYQGTAKAYKLCFSAGDAYFCNEGKVEEGTMQDNLKPALEKLNLLSKDGWEVYSVDVLVSSRTRHLRRKL